LSVSRRAISFFDGIALADEFPLLRTAEIPFPLVVIDARPSVDPHDAVAWTRHTRRYLVLRRLSEGMATDSNPDDKQAPNYQLSYVKLL
jgi:hypothetical protein